MYSKDFRSALKTITGIDLFELSEDVALSANIY